MATETPTPRTPKMTSKTPKLDQSTHPAHRNGRWSGYRHLLWARIIELKREPEVVFWVFIFPLLLAGGLGIAFRNKAADVTSVVVIEAAARKRRWRCSRARPIETRPIKIPPSERPSLVATPRSMRSTSASTISRSRLIPTAATLTITIPLDRRACSLDLKLTPRSNPPPHAKMRSPLPPDPPANRDRATSTSSFRDCWG